MWLSGQIKAALQDCWVLRWLSDEEIEHAVWGEHRVGWGGPHPRDMTAGRW